jgi:uncharacterized membrane protein
MRSMLKRLLETGVVVAALAIATPAHAEFKIRNGSPNVLWVVRGLQAFCSWTDGCADGIFESGFAKRVDGWYRLDPGQTATLFNHDFGNADVYWYAEDDFGHFWKGQGFTVNDCVTWAAFGYCEGQSVACDFTLPVGLDTSTGDTCCTPLFCGLERTFTRNLIL